MNRQDYQGVYVFIQQNEGKVSSASYEVLGKAKELAKKLRTDVTAILLGAHISDLCGTLAAYGADKIMMVDNSDLCFYSTRPYAYCICQIVERYKPAVLLFGATAIGRDLAPRVAARIHTGLAADCTELEVASDGTGNLQMTRPVFGGSFMATIVCPDRRPQMATVRPGIMRKLKPVQNTSASVNRLEIEIPASEKDVKILQVMKREPGKAEVQNAKVLVSGGRGMERPENFRMLEELAKTLGGAVSATKACVDAGWVKKELQVGQTGKTVRPNLYLACGISGAIQHLAGMEGSDLIMAVNLDESAPIFKIADFGIVGDALKIIPILTEEIKKAAADREKI